MHMLNCIVTFKKQGTNIGCSNDKSQVHSMARRLTSDMYPSILNNAYLKPSYKCPYYFINNTKYEVELNSAYKLELILDGAEDVYNNPDVNCRIEIRCGDCSKYRPYMVYFDYIKTPAIINLTYEEIENGESSTDLEFPEYVCYEIINRLVKLALENASDPRLETNHTINQTIAGVSNNN